jgi:hypothetical protein
MKKNYGLTLDVFLATAKMSFEGQMPTFFLPSQVDVELGNDFSKVQTCSSTKL